VHGDAAMIGVGSGVVQFFTSKLGVEYCG